LQLDPEDGFYEEDGHPLDPSATIGTLLERTLTTFRWNSPFGRSVRKAASLSGEDCLKSVDRRAGDDRGT
jgi:hypothetical protein